MSQGWECRGKQWLSWARTPGHDAYWESDADDARFVIADSYLEPAAFSAEVQRAGLTMTFDGKRFPLESYARAFEAAGLLIEAIREPPAPQGARSGHRWARLPMFLLLRAAKRCVAGAQGASF